MKRKGKPKMPKGSFGQANMQRQQQQQAAQQQAVAEGQTVFYLYCRTSSRQPWLPVSALQGDGKSDALISAWLNAPVGKDVFKNKLDENVAASIFQQEGELTAFVQNQYGQFVKDTTKLEWGFKIEDANIAAKEQEGA